VIVSGYRKGVGSSRETATQCEVFSGIRLAIAVSFAPIHAGNNINQGLLMGTHDMLVRLQAGEGVPLRELYESYDPITQLIIQWGGLFPFSKAVARGEVQLPVPHNAPRPMTMGEKILARHMRGVEDHERYVKPGDAVVVDVDGGYTHEFTTAQVHYFLGEEYGADYEITNPQKFAVFEDHLIYADDVPRCARSPTRSRLRDMQREFQRHTGCRDFSAKDNISPGICHEVAREYIIDPGDFIQATDSHTCMGGVNNALAWGVGATEYANLVHSGFTTVEVSESIRFELTGVAAAERHREGRDAAHPAALRKAAADARPHHGVHRSGTADAVARRARHAREHGHRVLGAHGHHRGRRKTLEWIAAMRPGVDLDSLRSRVVSPDPEAEYAGGVHVIDLAEVRPMVAHPGDPDHGIPSDPTNGALIEDVGDVKIDIAYAGSCTAGKIDDFLFYHQVAKEAVDAGLRVADGVQFFVQFGSQAVEKFARENGLLDTFERAGAKVLNPGCGACIGCGPGVSETGEQVTVSAINRNYKGRSGPGKLWLASPLTVAASAFTGTITAYTPGMFVKEKELAQK
jgi:3-isopropylmalate/(R)-2-methylmalate dehydratase large subunit